MDIEMLGYVYVGKENYMGLLDRLIRKEISKGVGGLVSGAIVDAINNSSNKNNDTTPSPYQTTGVNQDSNVGSYTYTDPNLTANYDTTNQYNYNYSEGQGSMTAQTSYQPYTSNSLSVGNVEENFYALLCSEFSGYTINRHVPSQPFGASQYAGDFTFGLYLDGVPKLFIMLVPKNKYQNRPYAHAKDASLNNGIPFQFYFLHFENNRDYVINRIKSVL